MKKIKIALLSIVFSSSLFGQTHIAMVKPEGSKLWGYCNEKGEMIVEAKFKLSYAYSHDGYAFVESKKKVFSVIDKSGEILKDLPAKHNPFALKRNEKDYFPMSFAGLWGVYASNGDLAVKPKYNYVSSVSDKGYFAAKIKDEYFVCNVDGSETKLKLESIVSIKKFQEGLAPFKNEEGLMGCVNTSGEEAIKPQFQKVGHFRKGFAWARTEEGMMGFINKEGEWVIKPEYEKVNDLDPVSGWALVRKGEEWMYINMDNETLDFPKEVERKKKFYNGFSIAEKADGQFAMIDKNGKWVGTETYDKLGAFKNGMAPAKKGDLWGFINSKGEWVIQPKFVQVRRMVNQK